MRGGRVAPPKRSGVGYDPAIAHFTQADTIIPNPANSQTSNRYAYVNNNPVKYLDPSGHWVCEGDNCTTSGGGGDINEEDYIKLIKDNFDWEIEGLNWSLNELEIIWQAGHDIKSYVDGLTGGMGQKWMLNYLGGTTFVHGNFPFSPITSYVSGNVVHIFWLNWKTDPYERHIIHELGHVYDNNSVPDGTICWAVICGGGNTDMLYLGLLGVPEGIRAMNGSNLPSEFEWKGKRYIYGNKASAEYFAQSFEYLITDQTDVLPTQTIADLMNAFIRIEAEALLFYQA